MSSAVINSRLNKIITAIRGDDLEFYIYNDNEDIYQVKENDNIYFGLMEPNCIFEEALIRKSLKNEEIIPVYDEEDPTLIINYKVVLKSSDTQYVVPGLYYYSIKLEELHNDESEKLINKTSTIINNTKFILLE